MSIDALQMIVTIIISLVTAISGGWLSYKRLTREDKVAQREQRRELRDDLYTEIDRLNEDNAELRKSNITQQEKILELQSKILELQAKINALELRLQQQG